MKTQDDVKKQILIVEDEGLIAADIQKRLERLGYSVPMIAHSGEEALRCARSTPFDLVLMDIRLQGDMDGITTAQELKTMDMPVVYVTAYADQETVSRAKITEPFGYILKPIADGDLRSTVQISIYKHEMERRLRSSEAWLSTTLRSVGDGIIATNTDGEIVFLNPVAEELTGWAGGEAHGRMLMDVLQLCAESTRRPAKNPILDLLPGENRNYTLISKAGLATTVEVECFENRSADEVLGAIVAVRDITNRKEMESRLTQSERMEAIASMAGGLAHDFNNQLTVILGYADELSARLSGEDQDQALKIQRAASAANAVTGQLLTLSRRDATRIEVLNVNEVIYEIQPLISHSIGKACTLTTNLGSPLGYIRGDRNQLKQVLLNLALRAGEAMPGRGELRIESSTVDIDPESPAARLQRPGPYVRLRIADSGTGMDQATLARIFEPSFTARSTQGSGLRLSLAHSIVVQSGGYITAASTIGRGTTFEILLPCIGTFRGLSEINGSESVAGEDATPTILLVEDEDGVRKLMHNYLEREGYQLLEARNAEEAELVAEVYREPIHVLVTDVVMPGMTGPQLAERLAPLRPQMKVLFVSGYRHDAIGRSGLPDGDFSVLPKPFPAGELLRRVRGLLTQVQ
jgi:two-component system, cell cycle sensor histidine kinase and response regulator CckA